MKFIKDKKELSIFVAFIIIAVLIGVGVAQFVSPFIFKKQPQNNTAQTSNLDQKETEEKQKTEEKDQTSNSQKSSSKTKSSSADRREVEISLPKPVELPKPAKDYSGLNITDYVSKFGYNMGFLWSEDLREASQDYPIKSEPNKAELDKLPQQPKNISEIVPAPEKCEKKNWLSYPAYNVEAPIVYASFKEMFNLKANGDADLNNPIVESPTAIARGNYLSVPIQRLLVNGIVHLPGSPFPGQVGNSYIVGHTSNFPSVRSNYNYIFKPFERKSKVGEEFFVWDYRCRKLKFKVYEVKNILAEDVNTAYKNVGDKRVVTLQGSILDANYQPTRRWITRGELVLE
jgi:sortase (surface protein transpeptidase)